MTFPGTVPSSDSHTYRQGTVTLTCTSPHAVTTTLVFTEGPAVDADGNVYFSDILGNRILKLTDPEGSTAAWSVFRQPSHRTNGQTFDREGRLYHCEGSEFGPGGGRRDLYHGRRKAGSGRHSGAVPVRPAWHGPAVPAPPNARRAGGAGVTLFTSVGVAWRLRKGNAKAPVCRTRFPVPDTLRSRRMRTWK